MDILEETVLTNSLIISKNHSVVEALSRKDRNVAIKGLIPIIENYSNYSRFGSPKIHLHDSEAKSLVRMWNLKKFGDDLSSFRKTINTVIRNREPISAIEIGRAGLLMRGLSPVELDDRYLGSIEFILDLDTIVKQASLQGVDLAIVMNEKYLPIATKLENSLRINPGFVLASSKGLTNENFLKELNEFNFNQINLSKNYILKKLPIQDFDGATVGYIIAGKNTQKLEPTVNHAKNALYQKLVIIGIIASVVTLVLYLSLQKIVIKPLQSISTEIQESRQKRDLSKRLTYRGVDEIGLISDSYNQLMELINLFLKKNHLAIIDISEAANIMSNATSSTSSGIKNQEIETVEVKRNLQLMLNQMQEIAENSQNASVSANQATVHAQNGKQISQSTINSIKGLAEEINQASKVALKLQEGSQSISNFTSVINGIAEQTNLLALNAAIEAARAGESGRGFAVVADEVRNLAVKTQESTHEIEIIIDKLKKSIGEVVEVMESSNRLAEDSTVNIDKTGQALNQIVESISDISKVNTEIAQITKNQVPLFENISNNTNSNVMQFNRMLNSSLEDTSQASYHMGISIREMYQNVDEFKINEDPDLSLHAAKASYFAWKTRVQSYILGLANIDDEDACPHSESYFGKWLASDVRKYFESYSEYNEIEIAHQQAHQALLDIISSKKQKDLSAEEEAITQLNSSSEKLFYSLDRLASIADMRRESNLVKAQRKKNLIADDSTDLF